MGLEISQEGYVHINGGGLISNGEPAPAGIEEIVLVESGGIVKAKLVFTDDGMDRRAYLWLQGNAIVASEALPRGEVDEYVVYNSQGIPVMWIDSGGTMRLRGLVYVAEALVRDVWNWPFS